MDGPPSAAAQLSVIYPLFSALINHSDLISREQSRHFGIAFGKFLSCPSRCTRFFKEQPLSYPIPVELRNHSEHRLLSKTFFSHGITHFKC